MNRPLFTSLLVIAIACLPAQAAELNRTSIGRITTLPTIEVRPSAEQRAEQAAIRAIGQRIVTLDAIEVRPTAEQLTQYAIRRVQQNKIIGKSRLRYFLTNLASN